MPVHPDTLRMNGQRSTGIALVEVVGWVIRTLVAMAQNRAWGEIRIIVQGGQIEAVHENHSHKGRLPGAAATDGDQVKRILAAVS